MSNKLSLIVNFLGVDKMSGALRSIIGLGRKGGRSLGELRGESKKLSRQLRDVRKQIAEGADNVDELAEAERKLKEEIADVNDELRERARLNQIEGQRRADIADAEALQAKGAANMRQGATLAAPLILAAREAGNFSSGMVDIQQKVGLTNARTEDLKNNILGMAAAARRMPEEMRAGLDVLLAKGMGLEAALAAMGPAGRLATAYKVEIPDAASAAFASINNLKVPASETARILDMMAAAGNEGAFEVKNMARHFPALTAQMQALGEKGAPAVADLAAALQVAMNTAGSEDEAGNNIKNLLAKINAPATIRAFQKNFGVDLPAAMKKLEDQGYSSLEAIALVTQEATGGDMKKLGFAFEDMQARQGIMALIQNLEEYRRVRDAAMNSGGTVDAAFDQRVMRDATVNWTAFTASLSRLGIVLGTTLLPMMTEGLNMVISLASGVSDWAAANPTAAKTIMQIVAGLALFKIGLGAAQFAIGAILKPIANLNAFVARIGGWKHILGMAKVGFSMLRVAVMFLAKGVMKAGIMMLANPVVLAIVALVAVIGGAAYLIYTHWDKIKAAFWNGVAMVQAAWEKLKGFLVAGFNWFATLPGRMARMGADIIRGLINGLMSRASAVWNTLKKIVMGGIDRIKNFLGIASPSKVFMKIGQQTGQGLAIGLERQRRRVNTAAGRLAKGAIAAGALAMTPAAIASSGAGGFSGNGATYNFTLNINKKDGETDEEFADRIMAKIKKMMRGQNNRIYEDLG